MPPSAERPTASPIVTARIRMASRAASPIRAEEPATSYQDSSRTETHELICMLIPNGGWGGGGSRTHTVGSAMRPQCRDAEMSS